MITTSSKYKTVIAQNSRHFEVKLVINNRTYTIVRNLNLKGGTNSSDEITFGDTVSSFIECDIYGVEKLHILNGQEAILYIGLDLDDGVEWIQRGIFTIENSKRSNEYVKITAYDNFYKCQRIFASSMKGNQKVSAIIQEACNKVGIGYTGTFEDVTYNVDLLSGMTVREAIGVLAAYCGKNATIDSNGKVKFVWYTDTSLTLSPSRYADPDMKEEDTFINKLECAVDDKNSISLGTGIGIFFSCPGMTKERLQVLYDRVKGFTYRAASVEWKLAQPEVESGDLVKVLGVDGTLYKIPLMEYNFSCDGGYYGTIVSKGKSEEEKTYEYKGPLQKKVERSYSEIIATKTLLADTIIAYEGNFETITTNYLNVSKKITAVEGEFETLTTKVIESEKTITNELLAISAKINTLETVDLKAITATIAQANIDIGKINTLLAGTVTAGSGQYIVLNAQNTVISNALIKSAMIDTLDFNKITGVDINTTNLKIHSKDGMSQWFDNTIQIKDANRQRVQIGKDASGDYNIYVWDKVGKLMFDATGITADGIQKPIIRDDMVATNANISGDKLNITSVITKINANSTLIESSHVKYDGKSLDVAFNSLQTTVENIDIGTRNLIINTTPTTLNNWMLTNSAHKLAIVDEPTARSGKAMTFTANIAVNNGSMYHAIKRLIVGNVYSWSVWVKCSKTLNLNMGHEQGGFKIFNITTEWQRFTHTFTASSSSNNAFIFYITGASWAVGDVLSVHSLILVDGNKPPASWTSAPEDTDGQIATLTESIKSQSTQISVAQGQIGTLIMDVSQSKSDIATVKGGLTTATGNISTLQSNYSTLNQTVSGLSATVGSHTSSITTLTETANKALSKIDGLEIGGRNLWRNSSFDDGLVGYAQSPNGGTISIDSTKFNSHNVVVLTRTNATASSERCYIYSVSSPILNSYKAGDEFILSAWIYLETAFDSPTNNNIMVRGSSGDIPQIVISNDTIGKWIKVVSPVFKATSDGVFHNCFVLMNRNGKLKVSQIMFEKGNKDSDWNTAVEDVDNRITTEIKTVSDKQASFDVLLTGITGRVSATESTVTTVTNTVNNNKANWDKAPTALANANNAQTTANTANTQANTNKSNIATLTTTVTETKSTVATLKLDYEGFKTNVSSTYTTKTEFNNLQIGGRNLLRFTGDLRKGSATSPDSATGINIWSGAVGTLTDTTEGLKLARNGSTNDSFWIPIASLGCVENGELVTLSFKYRTNTTNTGSFYFIQSSGANISIPMPALTISETEWKEFKWTFSNTQANIRVFKSVLLFYGQSATGQWIEIKKGTLKLEKGSKATDWTPSPEDIDASIATVDGKFVNYSTTTQMNSAIEQTKNSITQSVASTYATQSALSGLTTRIATAESKITDSAIVNTVRKSVDYTNDLNKKTGKSEILSTINQSAEAVKINAAKIDLSGYVTITNAQQRLKQVVDLTGASYNQNTFYPVVGSHLSGHVGGGYSLFELNNQLDYESKPTWSTHAGGFTCNITARMKASGWGTTNVNTLGWIDDFSYLYCDQMPAYISQMTNSSYPVFFLRGGGKYNIFTDYICTWSVKTSTFTNASESVSPIVLPNKPSNLSYFANNITNDKAIGTWCYNNDVTFIDGGKIYTGTITADKINANTLSAISANLGSVTAGSISGVSISGATITGGSISSNTTINVTTDLTVGDNIRLGTNPGNQKTLYFNDDSYIKRLTFSSPTWSGEYLRMQTNMRTSIIANNSLYGSASISAWVDNGINQIDLNASNIKITGVLTTQGNAAWIGKQHASGGEWFGFYNAYNGTRKGWIGHDGGNDFNFTNDAGGVFDFNKPVFASEFYDRNGGGYCTAGRGIRFFRHVQEQKYIEIGTNINGAFGIYYTVSDRKYKKDIQSTSVKSALGIINQLEHVQFNWIDGGSHVDIGYIANDVKDIMPGLVFNVEQPDGSDQYNINQTTFLPLITKGMQEQHAEVQALKQQVSTIPNEIMQMRFEYDMKIQDLKNKISQLESLLN